MIPADPGTNTNAIGIRGWRRCGEAPFAALAASFALGILLSSLQPQCSFLALSIAAGSLALASAAAAAANRPACSLSTALCSIVLVGALTALARRDGVPGHDVRNLIRHGALPLHDLVQFEGCVSEEGTVQQDDLVFTLALRAVNYGKLWKPCRGDVLVRMPVLPPGAEAAAGASLRYGDRVRGWGQLDMPHVFRNPGSPDRRQILARRGVFLTGSVKSPRLLEVIPGDCGSAWRSAAADIRRRVRQSLDTLSASGKRREASILASILIGDYSGLDAPTLEAFQNSGTLHVLVVSGLHVGWIAWVLLRVLRLSRCPEQAGRLVAAAAVLAYTVVVGFQASISRSLWMFILYICGQALFRGASAENIAAASAFLLLAANPAWLFDPGFQLSFLSVLAICLMGAPLVRNWVQPLLDPLRRTGNPERLFLEPGRLHRLGRSLRVGAELRLEQLSDRCGIRCEPACCPAVRLTAHAAYAVAAMVMVSLSVQVWIEPVLAFHYNRLSWISAAANIAVIPLSSLVLALAAIGVTAATLVPSAGWLLAAAAWCASLLYDVTRWVAGVPFGWQRCPTPPAVLACAVIFVVASWCFFGWGRRWLPCAAAGIFFSSLAAAAYLPRIPGGRPVLRLTFLDVGQGDSAVVSLPDGRTWVVDAGGLARNGPGEESVRTFDTGERIVSRYLWSRWITGLDRVVLSHLHQDHGGGVAAILNNFPARSLYTADDRAQDAVFAPVAQMAIKRAVPVGRAQTGDATLHAGVEIRTLHPPAGASYSSPNECSVVLHLRYENFAALLPGDLEREGERTLLASQKDVRSSLLKVAHHGSRFATPDEMLDRVQPRWAIISAGRHNPFGNPARQLLMRLLRRGVRPLLTMDHGAISLTTDGESYVLASYVCGVLESGALDPSP